MTTQLPKKVEEPQWFLDVLIKDIQQAKGDYFKRRLAADLKRDYFFYKSFDVQISPKGKVQTAF